MPAQPTFSYERRYWNQEIKLIAGIDEVGMGALAGPVVAGAVVFKSLPNPPFIKGGNPLDLAYIPYNSKLKEPAREQRKTPTRAERCMWDKVLKQDELKRYRFLRQKPLDNFIADFYCRELLLVIEVDGDSHKRQREYDELRTEKLKIYNIEVVRFTNDEVTQTPERVYKNLLRKVNQRYLAVVSPLDKGGLGDFGGGLIRDSKTLSAAQREKAAEWIEKHALAWAIGEATVKEINEINIRGASHLAMRRAIQRLRVQPDLLLIDGNPAQPHTSIPAINILKGDAVSISIAAASILAKVHRDRLMVELGKQHPEYGFEKHKGYGSKQHLEALSKFGATNIHRIEYAPVARVLTEQQKSPILTI